MDRSLDLVGDKESIQDDLLILDQYIYEFKLKSLLALNNNNNNNKNKKNNNNSIGITRNEIMNRIEENKVFKTNYNKWPLFLQEDFKKEKSNYFISSEYSYVKPFISDQKIEEIIKNKKGNNNIMEGTIIHVPFSIEEQSIVNKIVDEDSNSKLSIENTILKLSEIIPGRSYSDIKRYVMGHYFNLYPNSTFTNQNIVYYYSNNNNKNKDDNINNNNNNNNNNYNNNTTMVRGTLH